MSNTRHCGRIETETTRFFLLFRSILHNFTAVGVGRSPMLVYPPAGLSEEAKCTTSSERFLTKNSELYKIVPNEPRLVVKWDARRRCAPGVLPSSSLPNYTSLAWFQEDGVCNPEDGVSVFFFPSRPLHFFLCIASVAHRSLSKASRCR